jgi:hypothetical protein
LLGSIVIETLWVRRKQLATTTGDPPESWGGRLDIATALQHGQAPTASVVISGLAAFEAIESLGIRQADQLWHCLMNVVSAVALGMLGQVTENSVKKDRLGRQLTIVVHVFLQFQLSFNSRRRAGD